MIEVRSHTIDRAAMEYTYKAPDTGQVIGHVALVYVHEERRYRWAAYAPFQLRLPGYHEDRIAARERLRRLTIPEQLG